MSHMAQILREDSPGGSKAEKVINITPNMGRPRTKKDKHALAARHKWT